MTTARELRSDSRRHRYIEASPGGQIRPRGTLVLIHAFPLNARMWEPQLALAESGWRVIAPHLRGFDGGTDDPAATSIDEYAGDIVDLLDALRLDEAVIGGLSMGGYVTFAIFRRAPRRFRGMVLADTRPQADTPEAAEGRRRMLQLVRDKGAEAVAAEMLPRLLADATRADRPEVVERVRSLVLANSREAIAGAVTALMTRPDSTSLVPTIHCPTLIIVGEQDVVTPSSVSEELRNAIPGSELVVVPGAGHLSSLEQPAAFNEALARFLEHRV